MLKRFLNLLGTAHGGAAFGSLLSLLAYSGAWLLKFGGGKLLNYPELIFGKEYFVFV